VGQIYSDEIAARWVRIQPTLTAKPLNKSGGYRKGVYRLKQERNAPVAANVEPPTVAAAFIGRAGEYAVMTELLFWGYNVSLMTIDNGVDVVACKDNQYFNLQVKTASAQDGGRFSFTIRKSSFDAYDKASTFYVFVRRFPRAPSALRSPTAPPVSSRNVRRT
jgi:hypothetical protein